MCEKTEQICEGQGGNLTAYDIQALTGAAEFFETVATGADPAPLAFAQSIRNAITVLGNAVQVDPEPLDREAVPLQVKLAAVKAYIGVAGSCQPAAMHAALQVALSQYLKADQDAEGRS